MLLFSFANRMLLRLDLYNEEAFNKGKQYCPWKVSFLSNLKWFIIARNSIPNRNWFMIVILSSPLFFSKLFKSCTYTTIPGRIVSFGIFKIYDCCIEHLENFILDYLFNFMEECRHQNCVVSIKLNFVCKKHSSIDKILQWWHSAYLNS